MLKENEMRFIRDHLWQYFYQSMKEAKDNGQNTHGIWMNYESILVAEEERADAIADFLEAIGFDNMHTGYYDPVEDIAEDCVDACTGYWYID